jgi:hypothetical protein
LLKSVRGTGDTNGRGGPAYEQGEEKNFLDL